MNASDELRMAINASKLWPAGTIIVMSTLDDMGESPRDQRAIAELADTLRDRPPAPPPCDRVDGKPWWEAKRHGRTKRGMR